MAIVFAFMKFTSNRKTRFLPSSDPWVVGKTDFKQSLHIAKFSQQDHSGSGRKGLILSLLTEL